MLHIDGCRSICKCLDKAKGQDIESHPDKVDGSYFLYKMQENPVWQNQVSIPDFSSLRLSQIMTTQFTRILSSDEGGKNQHAAFSLPINDYPGFAFHYTPGFENLCQ